MLKNLKALFFCGLLGLPTLGLGAPMLSSDSSKPVEIDADSLEVLQEKNLAVFRGNVIAKQGAVTLKAGEMLVHYAGPNAKNQVSRIDVKNNVKLTSGSQIATGDAGTYDVDKDLITLNGNVTLQKDQQSIKGASLVYSLASGQSRIVGGKAQGTGQGRVKGIFIPTQKTSP